MSRWGGGGAGSADYVVMSPSGQRMPVDVGGRAGYIDLAEQGFYEVHDANVLDARPLTLAVNVDLAESDLTAVDPEELAGMVTGRAGGDRADRSAAPERVIAAEDLERQQSIWWYLLLAAALLFFSETLVSNRLSRTQLSAG